MSHDPAAPGALLPSPERIALVGPMGAGKTAVGQVLAARLGWAFVDTDAWVEERAGAPVAELFARRGEAAFRALEREAVAAALARRRVVVATGGGAVLDPLNRARLLAQAFVVGLEAPPATLLARAAAAGLAARPLLAGPDPAAALDRLLAARAPLYAQVHARVLTDGRPPAEVAAEVEARWRAGLPAARVELPVGDRRSVVWVGPGLAARAPALLAQAAPQPPAPAPRAALLVADAHTGPLHGPLLEAALSEAGLRVAQAQVPAGEAAKSLEQAARLWTAAAAAELERGDPVVALGGGAVTDLAGFVAASWLRGVPWLALPTSLLAQVDAALGGKTGINLPEGKNLVGAFHPPAVVVCDTALLATLPEAEWHNGLAECVKHGAIADPAYFAMLERHAPALRARAAETTHALVEGSVRIKAAVVAEDPFEAGRRAILNFGHTVGHALERLLGYGGIRHGEAVAVGMAVAADLSVDLGLLAPADRDRLEALLTAFDLPVRLPGHPAPSATDVLAAARLDKKRRAGRLRWVLLAGLGQAVLREVDDTLVLAALRRRGAR